MKAAPTLEGGLRIDAEDFEDWNLLRSVIVDATSCETDLASRLGGLIHEAAGAEDWLEYIVPDLREGFGDELAQVATTIESAMFDADGEGGPLWIKPEDAFAWYSAFNQARLALEERHRFGPENELDVKSLNPAGIAAFLRSRFYCAIQSLLLEHVMG